MKLAQQYYENDNNGQDATWSATLVDNYTAFFKQFGYVILFIPLYPAAAILCFTANWLELIGDMKTFTTTVRALPVGAQDIGAWESCFYMLVYLAVPVNCAIVVFTMTAFDSLLTEIMVSNAIDVSNLTTFKLLTFVLLQW